MQSEPGSLDYRLGPTRWRIVDDILVIASSQTEGAERRVPLDAIEAVRVYVFMGTAACVLTPTHGRPVYVASPIDARAEKAAAYVAFVESLHAVVAARSPAAKFVGGHVLFFALFLTALFGILAVIGLGTLVAVMGKDLTKALPLAVTVILPAIAMRVSTKGLPRRYEPSRIPASCLPPKA